MVALGLWLPGHIRNANADNLSDMADALVYGVTALSPQFLLFGSTSMKAVSKHGNRNFHVDARIVDLIPANICICERAA